MLDLSYFQNQNSNVQGFFSGGTWQTWIKPKGAKLVNIICQGSGAGGGGGLQLSTGAKTGGAAGGSGGTARLTIDANLLPNRLYILTGIGGIGGLGGTTPTAGGSGGTSFVTLIPDATSNSNIVLRSNNAVGAGGPAASSGGVAGATITGIGNCIFGNLGTFTFQGGVAGIGGQPGNAATTTPTGYTVFGTGGGGNGTGGRIAGTGVIPGTTAAAVNTNGYDGFVLYKPTLILYGGGGGGGSLTAGTNGGNGGNGAPGCGGGGGGASTNTGVNAGNGGKGGDGFVIITTSL